MEPSRAAQFTGSDFDEMLGEIIDRLTEDIRFGKRVDFEHYKSEFPDHIEQIKHLLPTLETMVRLGRSTDGSPIDNQATANCSPEQRLGDFRIGRELGRGGMGVVYEAEQISMGDRKVALKVLPFAAVVDEKSLQRFRNEVRAAAALDNPNIVPVYSVGEERGLHFYAMRLIRGQTVAAVINQLRELRDEDQHISAGLVHDVPPATDDLAVDSLASDQPEDANSSSDSESGRSPQPDQAAAGTETAVQSMISTANSGSRRQFYRSIVELGIQAADALAHAHRLGVIHRDIKPANLMLDATARLYITDFGLAQIENDVGVTMTGDVVGTLRYMAPEQAQGKRNATDQRADIYSLGATLYELLTLKPVLDGENRETLLKQIAFQEPPTLRKVDRNIPQDLETIVHKSIAKNPDERYLSAEELASDLRAFRDNQPIVAKPPSLLDKSMKWVQRNQGFVAAATIIMLITTIGLAISNAMVARQSREAKDQRDRANRLRIEADQQRREAEENFQLAFDAVDQMLTEVASEDLVNVPRAESVRRALLEKALTFYQGLLRQRKDDPIVRSETAQAQLRTGEVLALMNDHNAAEEANRGAMLRFESLAMEKPGNPEIHHGLVKSRHQLAAVLEKLGRWTEQEHVLRLALTTQKNLVKQFPDDPRYHILLASCYSSLSNAQWLQGNLGDAIRTYQEGRTSVRLAAHLPDADQIAAALGTSHSVADAYFVTNQLEQAEEIARESVQLWERLSKESLDNVQYTGQLAASLRYLAVVHFERGQDETGIKAARRAVEIYRKLVSSFPAVPAHKYGLAYSLHLLATGQGQESLHFEVLDILRNLAQTHPDVPDYSRGLAIGLSAIAEHYRETNRLEQADKYYAESTKVWRALDAKFVKTPGYVLGPFVWHLGNHARVLHQMDRSLEAELMYRECLSLWAEMLSDTPELRAYGYTSGIQHTVDLAAILTDDGRYEEAAAICREAMSAEVGFFRRSGQTVVTPLASACRHLVVAILKSDHDEEIDSSVREQLLTWTQLQSESGDEVGCLAYRLELQTRYAHWLKKKGRTEEGEACFRHALRILQALPLDEQRRVDAVAACVSLWGSHPDDGAGVPDQETRFHRALAGQVEPTLVLARGIVKEDPDSNLAWNSWNTLAVAHHRQREWRDVETDVTLAIKLATDDPSYQAMIAPLLLLNGQTDAYAEICRYLMDNWQKWRGDDLGHAATMCSLNPLPPSEPQHLLRLAQRAVAEGPGWSVGALSRVCYRVAQYDQFMDQFASRSQEPQAKFDLAIVQHLAGHHDEARASLERALQSLKGKQSDLAHVSLVESVLRDEAERRIIRHKHE